MWYARSAEFLQTDLMETLRWLRVVGDTIFALGIMGEYLARVHFRTMDRPAYLVREDTDDAAADHDRD